MHWEGWARRTSIWPALMGPSESRHCQLIGVPRGALESGALQSCLNSLLWIPIGFRIRENAGARDGMALAGPFAEIDQFAALGAERAKRALIGPRHDLVAGRTVYFQ